MVQKMYNSYKITLGTHLDCDESCGAFVLSRFALFFSFFFLFSLNILLSLMSKSASMHCLWTHKFYFSATFSLKMSLTILFTYLKIILL